MHRALILAFALMFSPAVALAQQPCTTDARHVVDELYRHILERSADTGSRHWVQQLESGRMTVRDVVREIAKSPEHTQRFFNTESGEGTPYERAVGTMYRHLLGRQPDAGGQRNFAQMAQRSGPGAVADSIVNSQEYSNTFGDWIAPGSGGVRYCGTGAAGSQSSIQSSPSTAAIRYRGMDRNNDGVISRSEWNGTVAAFYQMDTNNDRTISRSEYEDYNSNTGRVSATSGDIVYVDPSQRWTNTGITVQAGDLVVLDASGSVTLSQNGNDVAGPGGARSGRRAADAPLSSQTAGALIAMVGNSNPIFVGNRRSFRAPQSGRLYLGVNDDYLGDNTGSFEVMVTVR